MLTALTEKYQETLKWQEIILISVKPCFVISESYFFIKAAKLIKILNSKLHNKREEVQIRLAVSLESCVLNQRFRPKTCSEMHVIHVLITCISDSNYAAVMFIC